MDERRNKREGSGTRTAPKPASTAKKVVHCQHPQEDLESGTHLPDDDAVNTMKRRVCAVHFQRKAREFENNGNQNNKITLKQPTVSDSLSENMIETRLVHVVGTTTTMRCPLSWCESHYLDLIWACPRTCPRAYPRFFLLFRGHARGCPWTSMGTCGHP